MKFSSLVIAVAAGTFTPFALADAAAAISLRGSNQAAVAQPSAQRRLKKPVDDNTCVESVLVEVQGENQTDGSYLACGTSDGQYYKVAGLSNEEVHDNSQRVANGQSKMKLPAGATLNEETQTIELPPGKRVGFEKNAGNKGGGNQGQGYSGSSRHNRDLAVTGAKKVLVVRVIAGDGIATTPSQARLSDSVFGNGNDAVNMRSQYLDCSYDQLDFDKAADRTGSTTSIINGEYLFMSIMMYPYVPTFILN